MEIKYSKQLMDNIDLKIDKGYKHIKEMMNEKYNNIILKGATCKFKPNQVANFIFQLS